MKLALIALLALIVMMFGWLTANVLWTLLAAAVLGYAAGKADSERANSGY